ncbi:MAG: ABC transporter permease subunit, partial [Litorilinea sp.]
GALGLWPAAQLTLALMAASVVLALALGFPLGIAAAKSPRFYAVLRPVLDAMQTLPAFVYLIPVLLFFGVARAPSVIATVIYALPPIVRLTASGILEAPAASKEAADAFGASAWQKLRKVELPLALPAIQAGINQTIMMALSLVVIAALIGAGGLGRDVLVALQRLRVGQGLEAGLAIVLIAVVLDRLFHVAEGRKQREYGRPAMFNKVSPRLFAAVYWSTAAMVMLYFMVVDAYVVGLRDFPEAMQFSISAPVDSGVRWLRDNLYRIGNLPIGTGPFSDFLVIWLLNPLRSLLQTWLPWPVVIGGFGLVAWYSGGNSGGLRLGVVTVFAVLATGLLGMWTHTLDTLSQVLVAVLVALTVGLPLGVWSAQNDGVRAGLRPVLDFLQTIPVFVYLVPVIMLFHVGRVPGIIASVLYAVPPVIRLTDLGIRRVHAEVTEAADAFGATAWQRLFMVQLPLALPTIMLGVNQTVMMVLAMVIIAGLVGGGALGFEAVNGLARNEVGRGLEAGIAIVCLAIVLDRLTQAWARRTR